MQKSFPALPGGSFLSVYSKQGGPMNQIRKRQIRRLLIYLLLLLCVLCYILLCLNGHGLSCFFYETFGIRCPSCGASRAFFSLLRLDFAEAARQNGVFAFALYPIGGLIALQDLALCLYNLIRRTNRMSFLQFLFSSRKEEALS